MLVSTELTVCVTWFHHYRICVTSFREGGAFLLPLPHIREQPRKNPSWIGLKEQFQFCQSFSAQHFLLTMTEKWQKYLHKDGVNGALLTDVQNLFKFLLIDLFIAKLSDYGFDYESLWKKRTKELKSVILTVLDITFEAVQGSILLPLFFNIFIFYVLW